MSSPTELAITSVHNPRVKLVRRLITSRKARQAEQQIVVEGVRLIDDALRSGSTPVALFFDPALTTANPPAAALVARVEASGGECIACAAAVFGTMAETVTPQGVLALLPMPALPLPPQPLLVLVLDGVRDPGNAGTLLRSAEAAGADLAIFGPGAVDPYNDKVLRGAMGAHFRLPLLISADWTIIRAALAGLTCFVAEAGQGCAHDQAPWHKPAALVIGSEANGPGAAARESCQPVHIPMHGGTESLNAAVAGSVILFEAARQRRARVGDR
jgi:TrmH family RNA methyltransferase